MPTSTATTASQRRILPCRETFEGSDFIGFRSDSIYDWFKAKVYGAADSVRSSSDLLSCEVKGGSEAESDNR
jgi:hypothetical protein